MPSGYTAKLYEGKPQEFSDFALNCARAIGYAVLMKDDGTGPVTVEGVKGDTEYHKTSILQAGMRMGEITAMSDVQLDERARTQYTKRLKQHLRSNQEGRVLRSRYLNMLSQVEAWSPPTPDHEHLKDHMTDQLKTSISFDCPSRDPFEGHPVLLSAEEFRQQELGLAQRGFDHNISFFTEQVESNLRRVLWVEQLQASL